MNSLKVSRVNPFKHDADRRRTSSETPGGDFLETLDKDLDTLLCRTGFDWGAASEDVDRRPDMDVQGF